VKKEEVRELARQFVAALEEEKQIRAKLLDLKLAGDRDEVERNLAKHDAMIHNIAELREKKMLPILETLGAFIAEKTGTARTPAQRLRDAIDAGKKRVAENKIRDGMPGRDEEEPAAKPAPAKPAAKPAATKPAIPAAKPAATKPSMPAVKPTTTGSIPKSK
jgi:hypothetical protein